MLIEGGPIDGYLGYGIPPGKGGPSPVRFFKYRLQNGDH